VTENWERLRSFVWLFVVVERYNGGLFLLMAAGRAEEVMLADEVVVVVGCFAASTAHLHLDFDLNKPNPP
jgi:hypothetical protein